MAPAMLPDDLVGALQRYKEDTNSVAAWLASTAKHCGYKSQTAEPNDKDAQQKPSGRLKGNARKEAKGQATDSKNGTGQKYTVALDDYVPMAKCIAAHRKATIKVPTSFVSTINRVIHLRSSFRARMVKQGVDIDENANKNHLYFVSVLETVRDVLRPNMMKADKQKSPQPMKPSNLTQGFSLLTVHEPSQEFLDAPDIERPKQRAGDSTTYEAEEQTSLDDALAVWHLLILDAGKIRNQIAWV
ncbi:uncharacterized protein BKA55DRAFT_689005 [Fusarium redolens]|uniref:DUF6604 domain-containing protein n=1 Tax=Fusarium redolens TaxID=48865 RepID=A0A9P9HBL6_FUSRE|nr:uncharacterized protein BKA55DRAFT_689005 [Fusarium redolens]KAH7253509.1 hypothetical protein BKA55DRAFT_689005 [Fusarium redolens]